MDPPMPIGSLSEAVALFLFFAWFVSKIGSQRTGQDAVIIGRFIHLKKILFRLALNKQVSRHTETGMVVSYKIFY